MKVKTSLDMEHADGRHLQHVASNSHAHALNTVMETRHSMRGGELSQHLYTLKVTGEKNVIKQDRLSSNWEGALKQSMMMILSCTATAPHGRRRGQLLELLARPQPHPRARILASLCADFHMQLQGQSSEPSATSVATAASADSPLAIRPCARRSPCIG